MPFAISYNEGRSMTRKPSPKHNTQANNRKPCLMGLQCIQLLPAYVVLGQETIAVSFELSELVFSKLTFPTECVFCVLICVSHFSCHIVVQDKHICNDYHTKHASLKPLGTVSCKMM